MNKLPLPFVWFQGARKIANLRDVRIIRS